MAVRGPSPVAVSGGSFCCCAQASLCDGFSCCAAPALGAQASAVEAHGLSCFKARGIFPDHGLNPRPLHGQADSQPLAHQGSPNHIFFIHLSVDGHLGCFHILAVVNNAAVNIGMHVSFELGFIFVCFVYIYLGVELLDHMVVLLLVFQETSILENVPLIGVGFSQSTCDIFQSENASQGRSKRPALGEDPFWGRLDPAAPALTTSPMRMHLEGGCKKALDKAALRLLTQPRDAAGGGQQVGWVVGWLWARVSAYFCPQVGRKFGEPGCRAVLWERSGWGPTAQKEWDSYARPY